MNHTSIRFLDGAQLFSNVFNLTSVFVGSMFIIFFAVALILASSTAIETCFKDWFSCLSSHCTSRKQTTQREMMDIAEEEEMEEAAAEQEDRSLALYVGPASSQG